MVCAVIFVWQRISITLEMKDVAQKAFKPQDPVSPLASQFHTEEQSIFGVQ